MRGRFAPLTLVLLAVLPGRAAAHRLEVEPKRLPDKRIQIEGWYNSATGDHPAARSRVLVRGADGHPIIEGTLDDKGLFTFAWDRNEPLTVEVSNPGHFKSIVIPPTEEGKPESTSSERHDAPAPRHRGVEENIKEGLIGVGFLLALAAFVLSLRNARTLRNIEKNQAATRESETPR